MFTNTSMRRMKARFGRRMTLTNMIGFVIILALFLFVTSFWGQTSVEVLPDGSSISSENQRLAYQIDPSPNSDIESAKKSLFPRLPAGLFGGGSPEQNQIDGPESARASSASVFRDGVLGNYEMKIETKLGRPGDNGVAFDLPDQEEIDQDHVSQMKQEYGVNMVASDYISMDRVVPDIRHSECKYWHYPEQLPTASVVIVFHNEGLTTLMRTVHSVLLRSPRKLIKEVLLLDDCSDKQNLGKELEQYILEHFGEFSNSGSQIPSSTGYNSSSENLNKGESLWEKSGKVRLVRNKERQGLIRSRSRGATEATGDVVVFLDAHCEVNHNWLPPLLAPIANNRKTLTVPIIDGIDSENFAYRPVYEKPDKHFRGIWEWGMLYKEIALNMSEHTRTHRISEPYDSPTHAGGLFAINRAFFSELGLYDPGLLIWGGENFELSFKVWQCGGRLQWVPCSRVGHIYRPFMPYTFGSMANQRKGPLVLTNYKRVVEVWFDQQYKDYFYTREPLAKFYDAGDIKQQLELKKRLQCKSFDWFMTNIASDVFRDFPRLPPNNYWGEIVLESSLSPTKQAQCLDTRGSQPPQTVIISPCHSLGGNQMFRLNSAGQLATGERCLDATRAKMSLIVCKLGHVDGPWRMHGKKLVHKARNMCLTYSPKGKGRLYLDTCLSSNEENDERQQGCIWRTIRPKIYSD